MKKLNLLSKAEMKKVMGGLFNVEDTGGVTCRFKFKTSTSEGWTTWTSWHNILKTARKRL